VLQVSKGGLGLVTLAPPPLSPTTTQHAVRGGAVRGVQQPVEPEGWHAVVRV